MNAMSSLVRDTLRLPPPVRRAMRFAVRSGWFEIEAGVWESETAVCPIVAAGKVAGYWRGRHLADGGPEWGDQERPSPALMAFAVSFDVCAEEIGTAAAIGVVSEALGLPNTDHVAA